jgi:hypothetical protein
MPDSAIAAETFHATAQAMLVIAMALQRTEAAQAATTPAR